MRHTWILALALFLFAQGPLVSQTITGSVVDARSGLPLEGANIVLVPGPGGTAADRSGRFTLEAASAPVSVLRVTHVGYTPLDVTIPRSQADAFQQLRLDPVPMPGPEIEVSAFRATERFSPVTFSELRGSDLHDSYFVQDVPVILSDLPSSTFYSEGGSGIGYNYLRIRGFDQRRLAVMINGVPQNDPEDHNVYWVDFADLLGSTEQIQVQRGAGSAFYGPPAIGGSVNLVTGDFADRKGVRVAAGAGSWNTQRYALSFGSGLLDQTYTLFGRLSRAVTDGYRDRSWVKTNSYYFAATRYDRHMTTRVNVYGGPISDGLVYYGLPKFAVKDRQERRKNYNYWSAENGAYTWTQQRRPQEVEEFSQPHYELLHEWTISDDVTLNNTFFHVAGQGYFDYDGTGWTDTTYYRLTAQYGYAGAGNPINPIIRAYVDNRQWGWLPRLTVRHTGGTLTAGLELRSHSSLHWGRIQWAEGLPAGLDPDRKYYEYRGGKTIVSAYAQELYSLSERLNVMGSLQAVYNRYRLGDEAFVGTDFGVPYLFFNPRLGLNYNLDAAWNIYGNISYTQREPRLKNLYDAAESSGGASPQFERTDAGAYNFSAPLVKPEKLANLELGARYSEGSVRALVNGYMMDFSDEIVKSGALDRFGQPITGNAERTLHLGLEFSGTATLFPGLDLDVNALLSRSRLARHTVWESDPSSGAARALELDGNRIAGFPERIANVRLTWRGSGLTVGCGWKYVGDQYTDNFQNEENKVDPFSVFNLTAAYRTPALLGVRGIDLRVSVENLFDALYAQSGEADQFFVGAERSVFFDIAIDW